MATDEHGLPVPSEERPLPWDFCDNRGSWQEREGLDTREFWAERDDAEFARHAANNIVECRDIVRRLAEKYAKAVAYGTIVTPEMADASRLWAKMKREANGDDVQV